MAARLGLEGATERHPALAEPLRTFAGLLERLAESPGDQENRQHRLRDSLGRETRDE